MMESHALEGTRENEVLGSILGRLGDVIGDGALRSLVHYGALEVGARLAEQHEGPTSREALRAAADLFHLQIEVRLDTPQRIELLVSGPPELPLSKPGALGLATGVLEGLLSRSRRAQMRLEADPQPENDSFVLSYRG